MSPEERRARGIRIRALLDDPDVIAVFEGVKADQIAKWEATHDPIERENLWRLVHVLGLLRSKLGSLASGEPDGSSTAFRKLK